MTTFRKLKKLMDIRTIPEPEEGFWNSYLPNLRKRMELEPIPWFLRLTPTPLISIASITLITLTVLTTMNLYKSPLLDLESVPRKTIIENIEELDYFISENFDSENIVKGIFPREIISPITGGGYYENF